jgi:hypothetical protein
MTRFHCTPLLLGTLLAALFLPAVALPADPELAFAVVLRISKDKKQVVAQVASGSSVAEAALIPADSVQDNPIWKKLEICHALRIEVVKVPEGYRVVSLKALDAGMLPMTLQGIAGDCLLKKALEYAPLVD